MSRSKSIPQPVKVAKLDVWDSQKAAFLKIKAYNKGKSYGSTVTSAQITTLNKILEDYISKFRHNCASKAKLYITMGNLSDLAGCCVKTAYNHLLRLVQAGLVNKKVSAYSFDGQTLTSCIEIEICSEILIFTIFTLPPYVHKSVDRGKRIKYKTTEMNYANRAIYKAGGYIP